ncbi:hypothetical protein [Stenotrophomonas lactitubi]|uniref:hypothetical protein n=1 Tax=Stenotrophomonas lactitubi TaxID=2045214 RepID=UPI003209CDF2
MPIEILIAPAAPAVESAGDFWKYGLPVVSLVAGILLKWVLDGALERRRDAAQEAKRLAERRDALKARQADVERSNLLALQPLMSRHVRGVFLTLDEAKAAMAEAQVWKVPRSGPGAEESRVARFEMTPIRARLHNRELAQEITEFVALHIDDTESKGAANLITMQIARQFDSISAKIGDEIRRLEDAELQLAGNPTPK